MGALAMQMLLMAMLVVTGCSKDYNRAAEKFSLGGLPSDFKIDPYIEAAAKLQSLGKPEAGRQLLVLARDSELNAPYELDERTKIAILCRMLFAQKPGTLFKSPPIGQMLFWNGGRIGNVAPSSRVWPLEPIEVVDGVPFLIVAGYVYMGMWDTNGTESYVRYCLENCDWSAVRYNRKSREQKEEALRKLLSSPKWDEPGAAGALSFLKKQLG